MAIAVPISTLQTGALDPQSVNNFLQSLSTDELLVFNATKLAKTLLDEISQADAAHKQQSSSRKVGEAVLPLIAGLEQYGRGLDVFANGSELLCPIWGGMRIVLSLAQEFGEYFDKLASMLEDIGLVLSRLPRYPHLYPDNKNLKEYMVNIYSAIFDFCTKARRVFRLGKERSRGIKRLTTAVGLVTALRVLWKPFKVEFGGIKTRIERSVQAIESEADVAERELANKERRRDDARWSRAEQSQRLLAEFIDDESAAKVNAWLSPVNVNANHKTASSLRHADTGTWFLDGSVFQTWLKEDNTFLWLHAIPGAGKTVLSSSVINYLRDNVQSRDTGLAYFYCDYKDVQKQEPSKVLGTILAMLAKQNRGVFDNIQAFFLDQLKTSPTFTADFDELLNNFAIFLDNSFKSVIIVVDALDESNPAAWDCLTYALKFLHQQCSNLKVFVTSRNELPIARAFEGLPSTSIEQSDVASDIHDFIAAEVAAKIAQKRLKLRDKDLERVIRENLVEGSKGMFQWVRCQIDTLCKLRNDKAIRSALSNLPRTLQDTYIRILQRIEDDHPDDVEILQKVLYWLVRGVRNLTLHELAEGIAIDPESGDNRMDFSAVDTDPEDILELLGGLVTVSAEKVVSLAHYSVKEFLVSEDIRKAKPSFWVGTEPVESKLASVCLTYLSFDDFNAPLLPDTEAFDERLSEYKFLAYAVQAWGIHAHRSEKDGHQEEDLVDLTVHFLQSSSGDVRNYDTWQEINHHRKLSKLSTHSSPGPLLCASWFGLTDAVRQLLDAGDDMSENLAGAFDAAASNGHANVIKAFLEHQDQIKGQNASADDEDDDSSNNHHGLDLAKGLYVAAANGHTRVIEHLLDAGADIDARRGKDRNALQVAALEGRTEAVKLLLKRGANHGIPCKRYGTPLAVAAEKGHQRTVEILLEAGANPNGRGGYYSSPLVSAIVGRNLHIIRLLIENGADVNARGGRHMYPIAAAASLGMDDLVKELCDCGARVNDEDDKGSDALYAVCLAGHLGTVKLLLKLGADINAKGGKHRSALGAASSEGHLEVVEHLIHEGANIQFFDEHYGNALQTAAYRGHEAVVRALISAGIDPWGVGGDKGPALVCAASCGQEKVIKALYELGSPGGPGDDNLTWALQVASFAGHEGTIRLLAGKGDINAVTRKPNDSNNCTALEAAAERGHNDTVKLLLSLGASIEPSDRGCYGSSLNAAIETDHPSIEVLETLLDAGADINFVCSCHEPPLVRAVRRGHDDALKLLLDRGANVNLKHETIRTALIMSAVHEDTTIMDLLLEHGADVNIVIEPKDMRDDIDDDLEESLVIALQTAAWHGHDHIVQKLVSLGSDLSVNVDKPAFVSALQVAAYRGHLSTVSMLIKFGGDVNQKGGYFGTSLQAAAYCGHIDVARALLEAGAFVNAVDASSHCGTALMAACWYEGTKPEMIQLLIDSGADVNAPSGIKEDVPYPLQVAAYKDYNDTEGTEIARILLDAGADPNIRGGRYFTALQVAAKEGDADMVSFLLERGADPNITGGQFHTPLQSAYASGYYIVIGRLFRNGAKHDLIAPGKVGSVMGAALRASCQTLVNQLVAYHDFDVNLQYGKYGNALQDCIWQEREDDAFYYILKGGADVNRVGGYYGTALVAAAAYGPMAHFEKLLEVDVDVNLGNERYPNAAFGAIQGSQKKALELLLKHGVDVVNPVSTVHGTALQFAARYGNLTIVRMLVKAGAAINTPACGQHGSPLQAAAAYNHKDVIQYLVNRGADISAKGGKNGSVLHAAALHCDAETLDMLLRKGKLNANEKAGVYGTPLQAAAAAGWVSNALILL
ncbi:ankyrin repeat-containing domain protein [Apodospora peruviana]|uniref:Ankyrin repeat-containing domain protein n=1 Tax=Apodospora peruviana TaxID=516989 RepID=A0AAE0M4S6_9PEZI|nr:ankyrin repeat-containing domain protein [Apodospora peruviana]